MRNCLQVGDPEFFKLCPRNEGHKLPDSMWNSELITTEWKQDWGRVSVEDFVQASVTVIVSERKKMENEESD